MRDLKYIIILAAGIESRALLFNGLFNHSDIWLGARKSIPGCSVISAGFCSISPSISGELKINCWGESESISNLLKRRIKSLGSHDELVISKTINRRHLL